MPETRKGPPAAPSGADPYSGDDLTAIIEAFTRARKRSMGALTDDERQTIIDRLELPALLYKWRNVVRDKKISREQEKKKLRRLAQAATHLMNCPHTRALEEALAQVSTDYGLLLARYLRDQKARVGPPPRFGHGPDRRTFGRLQQIQERSGRSWLNRLEFGDIYNLPQAAEAAIQEVENLNIRPGRKPDRALQLLIAEFAPLYEGLTGRLATAHYDAHSGISTSPFVRVLLAILEPLGSQRTEAQIGDQVSRLRRNRVK